jgi:acyl-CoA synthetase (AMP-forming)/AMP-acid ligase II
MFRAEAIAFMLQHGEARALLTDREFAPVVGKALELLGEPSPLVIEIEDDTAPPGDRLGVMSYAELLAEGDPDFDWQLPADEWDAIALKYTSGTTGNPKGVVTHHRGAYLNAANNAIAWNLPHHPCLPVDAADVPLQRLVLPLDHGADGGHERVRASGRSGANLVAGARAARHPHVRRPDRLQHADRRAGRVARGHRPPAAGVCTENSNTGIMVVKSSQDGA